MSVKDEDEIAQPEKGSHAKSTESNDEIAVMNDKALSLNGAIACAAENAAAIENEEDLTEELNFEFEDAMRREEASKALPLERHLGQRGPSSSGRYRSIVCRHWIRNMCWKGDSCEFLHQIDNSAVRASRESLKTGAGVDGEAGSTNIERPDDGQVCLHYFLGFCRAGPKCRKKHEILESSQLPTLVPDWYLYLILENAQSIVPKELDRETEKLMEEIELKCRHISAVSGKNASQEQTAEGTLKQQVPSHEADATSTVTNREAGSIKEPESGFGKRSQCLVTEEIIFKANTMGLSMLPSSSLGIPGLNSGVAPMRVRVFMIKSSTTENILKSIRLGVWATGKHNTRVLDQMFIQNDHVILLFSANESGGFQGYARMMTRPIPSLHPNLWGTFSIRLGPNFRVKWLKQCRVEFERFGWLTNPLNDNQPLRKSRDCQEVPPSLAAIVCTVLNRQPSEVLLAGTADEHLPRIDHDAFFDLTETERVQKETGLVPCEASSLDTSFLPNTPSAMSIYRSQVVSQRRNVFPPAPKQPTQSQNIPSLPF